MAKITFILGGARSGKSNYALELAKKHKGKIAFIATCQPFDAEMKQRIAWHKKIRPSDWQCFEEYQDITALLQRVSNKFDLVIIDCLTLLVTNLMLAGESQKSIEKIISRLLLKLKNIKARSILVSNEVGLGIVPVNKLGRDFRDIAGKVNQLAAKNAGEVFFMVSGIPWRIKCKK